MPSFAPTRRPRAFTIVEVLAIAVIISILATLTLAGLNRFRESARAAKCLANLRLVGGAAIAYTADNDDKFPPSVSVSPSGAEQTFASHLMPYLGITRTRIDGNSPWRCPSALLSDDANPRPDYSCNERYSSNSKMGVFPRQSWGQMVPDVRRSQVSQPSKLILFLDTFRDGDVKKGFWLNGTRWNGGSKHWAEANYFGGTLPVDGPAPRHANCFNAVFCDGHVEAISWSDPALQSTEYRQSLLTP